MANCPNCGSEHIQLKKNRNVNWGRAVAGWALFGVVGAAVGAVTGEDINANCCLDCGTSWKATDLYKTRQVIKNLTGITLDLAYEEDRYFLNDFIPEISPYIEAISDAEAKAKSIIKNSESKLDESEVIGCFSGFTMFILFFVTIAITGGGAIIILLLALPFIGYQIGKKKDKVNRSSAEKEIIKAQREAEKIKIEAEENLNSKLEDFMNRYPL